MQKPYSEIRLWSVILLFIQLPMKVAKEEPGHPLQKELFEEFYKPFYILLPFNATLLITIVQSKQLKQETEDEKAKPIDIIVIAFNSCVYNKPRKTFLVQQPGQTEQL